MTIKIKALLGTLLLLVVTGILAGNGVFSAQRLSAALQSSNIASQALRNHLEADMMHDALRGDVLAGIVFSRMGDAEGMKGVAADLEDHSANIQNLVAANDALPLPENVKAALKGVSDPLQGYIVAAKENVAMSLQQGSDVAMASYPAFQEKFSALEEAMEQVSDSISAYSEEIAASSAAEAEHDISLAKTVAAVVLAIVIGIGLYAQFGLVAPLVRITNALLSLADGRTDVKVADDKRRDEVGAIARALSVFRDKMRENDQMRIDQERLKRQAEEERKRGLAAIADEFEQTINTVVSSVANAATEMQLYADSLISTAEKTSLQAASVAAGSEQASANVANVASATEELSSSIGEISRQVSQSSGMSAEAVTEAEHSNQIVSGLAEAAQKIGAVVELISDIANQTNLLALNATIEAARAGEAGKGFAVVASEVKNLASQTAKATEDITSQISGIQQVATEAVSAIQGISRVIEGISSVNTTIAAAVEEQSAATTEISRNVQEAASGTRSVSGNTQSVAKDIEGTLDIAGQVKVAAEHLSGQSMQLQEKVDRFISGIRAA